jgi:hypothetical protein
LADEAIEWARCLTNLREYKKDNGSCDVPVGCPGYRDLGTWVQEQRQAIKSGELHPRRARLLRDLGFGDNCSKDAAWSAAVERLIEFIDSQGHSDVPLTDPELGIWVYRQRRFQAAGILEPERVRLLNHIGFAWSFDERGVNMANDE